MELPWPRLTTSETVVILVIATVLLTTAVGIAVAETDARSEDSPFAIAQTQVDADAVLLSADIRETGDAVWLVEYRVRLADENTTAAFEDLQADVEANKSAYTSRFTERMTATVEDASVSTGRSMAVRNVSVTATTQQLPQSYGVLRYRFEWSNFAVVDGDRLRAGDALAGFFLDGDSSLVFSWPAEYQIQTVSPEPTEQRERSVVWRGPTEFGTNNPTLVVTSGGTAPGADSSFVGLAIVVAVFLAGGILWWWRYRWDSGEPATTSGQTPEEAAAADRAPSETEPPDELLSNEERVIALIEQHGGRMKQQDVVEELGWTDAKTSQVVGKLRETGDLEGFRLGRENVLRLPEVDDSPAPGDVTRDDSE